MTTSEDLDLSGTHGHLLVRRWPHPAPRYVALIAHGYGEHSGRYGHVAERLTADGAVVYAPDHAGHGRSDGERAHLGLVEDMIADLRTLTTRIAADHPGLPVVLIGHSMGGIIATRYIQRYGPNDVAALVLSGPVVGGNPAFSGLLALDPIPDVPIDPAILSRDPAVGKAYAADPLVYHGPLTRESLEALDPLVNAIAAGGNLGALPTLWLHGELDQLAPLEVSKQAIDRIRGTRLVTKVYPGAQHEIFNEINSDEVLGDLAGFINDALASTTTAR